MKQNLFQGSPKKLYNRSILAMTEREAKLLAAQLAQLLELLQQRRSNNTTENVEKIDDQN